MVVLAAALSGCDVIDRVTSPTSPSPMAPAGPPAANVAVEYAAIGASDANGVGGTVPCVPFTACSDGTGYVPVLGRQLRTGRDVTVINLGIPASTISSTFEALARAHGRDVPSNFIDRQMPFVPRTANLVTIFAGPNDANAVGDAIAQGAAGSDVQGYIASQAAAFGADYARLIAGVRDRAPESFIIVLNVPNLAGMPYAVRYPLENRRVLQAIAVAMSREASRRAGTGVAVLDMMCDPSLYAPSNFSSDGFHPNDTGYAHIASRLAAIVNGAPGMAAGSCPEMTLVPPL